MTKENFMKIDTTTLEAQPFFRGMPERQLELLANESMPSEFKAGERIFSEGGVADRFYIALEGRVELESSVMEGEAVHIQTLGRGDVLGWSWLFPPYCWHFDARAIPPARQGHIFLRHALARTMRRKSRLRLRIDDAGF